MRIDIGDKENPKPRNSYFASKSVSEILTLQSGGIERKGKSMQSNVGYARAIEIKNPGQVILGAIGATNIDDLIERRFSLDRKEVVRKMSSTESLDKLIVLPSNYRIGGFEAQKVISYEQGTLVRLDSMKTKRQLVEDMDEMLRKEFSSGSFSYKEMTGLNMTPELLISAAIKSIAQDNFEKTRSGYAWKSPSDPGLHIVSLLRSIEGCELQMLQNYAAWKNMPDKLRQSSSKKDQGKLRRMEKVIEVYQAEPILDRLDLSERDLIEVTCRPRMQRRGWHLKVASRRDSNQEHYITIHNMPIYRSRQVMDSTLPLTWSVVANDSGNSEQQFRQGRRYNRRWHHSPTKQDVYFTANSIAAMHTVRKIHKYKPQGWQCANIPIMMPKKELQDFTNKMR